MFSPAQTTTFKTTRTTTSVGGGCDVRFTKIKTTKTTTLKTSLR